jgi:DNA-binding NarL/FixJ family response regulator
MIRVVLADDQNVVRQGIKGLLELTKDIEVVGEAEDGNQAVAIIEKTKPDIALLDVRMPRATGLDAARILKEKGLTTRVILLTTFDDDKVYVEAVKGGIAGLFLKDVDFDDLADAIRDVAAGKTRIVPKALPDDADQAPLPPMPQELTSREVEVLRLMARGFSNREIADANGTAEGTVKNQVSSILLKLGVRDRTQAVVEAQRRGII